MTNHKLFAAFRKQGIVDYNRSVLQTDTQMLTYFVRNGQKEAITIIVIDVQAMQWLYQKATFYRNCSHRTNDTASIDKGSISATVLTVADLHEQDSSAECVLAKFVNDDVGHFSRTDVTLMKSENRSARDAV